ncbi:hypothetical protein GCM10009554_04980 [Kribbella koreensis]|uniref:Uncharacterized protein n=1 Tax=Kribbella koreensis TaxID=57909 RepID=A0ABP3ZPR6_9ACTN
MPDEKWSTDEAIDRAYDDFISRVPDFVEPYAHGIGLIRPSSAAWFPLVNVAEQMLPAIVVSSIVAHSKGTEAILITPTQLIEAISALSPAESHPTLKHVNLAAWRRLVAVAQESDCELRAVFLDQEEDTLPEYLSTAFMCALARRREEKNATSACEG